MTQINYFEGIGDSLVNVVSEIFKEPYSQTSVETYPSEGMCVFFKVAGDLSGDFCIVFENAEAAAKHFLMITVGDSEAAGITESCQEIANQIVGRILGCLSENDAEVEITYPGVVEPARGVGEVLALSQGAYGLIGLAFTAEQQSADVDLPEEASAEEPVTENEEEQSKARVLIVDDSPVMCAFLEKIFLENGYEVVGKAADGEEALDMFEQTDPDVVTLDIVMPKLKGTEVLQKILKQRPDAAVVMASSVSDAKTVMSCLKMGAKRYIIKPYDKKAVIGAVEKALGLSMGV